MRRPRVPSVVTSVTGVVPVVGRLGRRLRRPPVRAGGRWLDPGLGRDGDDGLGGVREPRRPKPHPPAGAMALDEPREDALDPS